MENMQRILTGTFQINTWIVPLCENKVFVVDPAACITTGDENAIIDYLKYNDLEPVGFFLTHGHFDHITGTAPLKAEWTNAPLACHKADCEIAGENAFSAQAPILQYMGLLEMLPALKDLPEPDAPLNGGERLNSVFGGTHLSDKVNDCLSSWLVIHTPGHSDGSCCLYNEKQKTLISGDTVFFRAWGRTDLPGGNEKKFIKSLKSLKDSLPDDTKVYPGHDAYGFTLGKDLELIFKFLL